MPTRATTLPARQRRKTSRKPKPKPSKPAPQSYDDKPTALTPVEYNGKQAAFEHFNRELFDGALPDLLITLSRKAHSAGHFAPNRYSERESGKPHHELSLNPDAFFGRTDEQVCSTIVHEMVHFWQHLFGKQKSRGYHNKEWAATMKSVGLYPSNTGVPGGKETGAQMTHYVIPGAAFARSFARLAATGWKLDLQSAMYAGPEGRKDPSKTKFTCPVCLQPNWWGKPDARGFCGPECGYPRLVPVKALAARDRTTESPDDVLEAAE